jgi:transposase
MSNFRGPPQVENAIRPSCVGKKNWLFIGHPDAGQRSAIIYSLIVSCQRHGKDPLAYLKDILMRLPSMTNQDDLALLLPCNWTQGTPTSASP